MATLKEILARNSRPAAPALVEERPDRWVRCLACAHRCRIPPGFDGVCKVRANRDGVLHVPWGYVAGLQCDPIEKKPFFHAFPGADALSFGMLGCDLHCPFCQNWITSQVLRDEEAMAAPPTEITAAKVADLAVRHGAPVVVSTYNEPLITTEWGVAICAEAKARGLVCGFVSNGNGTPEVLRAIRPHVDLYKVDLKGFDDRRYRSLGCVLANVLGTIEGLVAAGFWVEVVTLVVPGFNDGEDELRGIARFLAGLSRDIPWHVTAFHRDYRMTEPRDTTADDLVRAAGIGREEGLRYVYAGNLPGRVGDLEHTCCPGCRRVLIERIGYRVRRVDLDLATGTCPGCGAPIAGYWGHGWTFGGDTGWRAPRPVC